MIKSAYVALTNTHNSTIMHHNADTWKKLWKLKMQDKLKLFLWKVMHNILPARSFLKRVIPIDEDQISCPLCNTREENLSHLFFNSPFSWILWRQWPINVYFFANQPISNWISIIINPSSGIKIPEEDNHSFQLFTTLAMDNLWFLRTSNPQSSLANSRVVCLKSFKTPQ